MLTGNLGVQPRPFRVNAAPLVGLRFGRHTVAGLGPTYIYARDGLGGHSQPGPVHVYGGRVFASRRLSGQVFAQAEAEALNHPHSLAAGLRRWTLNPLAGVSWNIRIGQRSFIQLTALYNFNYQGDAFNRQIYNSPWVFRVGAGS